MNTTPIDHKIEFMAWDSELNEWCDADIRGWNSMFDLSQDSHKDGRRILKFENSNYPEIIPMQRTALRSINDEPIYNHMIVKNENGTHYVVDMFDYNKMYFLSGMALEIVGNRFQHQHLLELCK